MLSAQLLNSHIGGYMRIKDWQ